MTVHAVDSGTNQHAARADFGGCIRLAVITGDGRSLCFQWAAAVRITLRSRAKGPQIKL